MYRGDAETQAFEVHPNYLSTLRKTAREQGSIGLVKVQGRPVKLTPAQREQVRRWSEQGVTGQEIARRLQVSDSMISRLVGVGRRTPDPVQDELPDRDTADTADLADHELPEPAAAAPAVVELGNGPDGAVVGSSPRLGAAGVDSRYAGAMLLHAFWHRVDAAGVLGQACERGSGERRFDDLGLLTGTSMAFALGVSSVEGVKHLIGSQVGPLAGLAALPELRTLRPRLAALADRCDPLDLQARLAAAMLTADAPGLGVYFVDDHFVPYEGAKPVGKGWNTKRRHAQRGRDDTLVTDYHGRAVCFASGEPSGLSVTLPGALDQLRAILGADAKILLDGTPVDPAHAKEIIAEQWTVPTDVRARRRSGKHTTTNTKAGK